MAITRRKLPHRILMVALALVATALTGFAAVPGIAAYFLERPQAFGLSPDGQWYAFVVNQQGENVIYTREPASPNAFKISGIQGHIDKLIWTAPRQFALRSRQAAGERLSLTDPSGKVSWDFTPPGYTAATLIANQPSPHRTGRLYFVARRPDLNVEELFYLTIPPGGVATTFDTTRVLPNVLGIHDWLFAPDGVLLGGIATQGAERKLLLAAPSPDDQSRWTEAHVAPLDRFPGFSGYGCPPGHLLAVSYFDGNYTTARYFELATRQFKKADLPEAGANLAETFLSPGLDQIDAYSLAGDTGSARPLTSPYRSFQEKLEKRTKLRNAVPLAVAPGYEQALMLEDNDLTAPKYWYVDLARKKGLLVLDLGESLAGNPTYAMKPLALKARDGVELPCFWTEPPATGGVPSSLVILVPGGPFEGVHREWSGLIQALAARGVAVLTVNYRGARGFGRSFYEAGLGQAAGAMITDVEDVLDAVQRSGTQWRKKLVLGVSFGGYLAIRAVAANPQVADTLALVNPLLDPKEFFLLGERDTGSAPYAQFERRRWMGDESLDKLPSLLTLPKPKQPIVILQSARDERVPATTARRYAAGTDSTRIVPLDDVHAVERSESWINITTEVLRLLDAD